MDGGIDLKAGVASVSFTVWSGIRPVDSAVNQAPPLDDKIRFPPLEIRATNKEKGFGCLKSTVRYVMGAPCIALKQQPLVFNQRSFFPPYSPSL